MITLGDFNIGIHNSYVGDFCDTYDPKCLRNELKCYIKARKPNLNLEFLTNRLRDFQNSCVSETDLSDFPKTKVTVIETFLRKLQPRIINYTDNSRF